MPLFWDGCAILGGSPKDTRRTQKRAKILIPLFGRQPKKRGKTASHLKETGEHAWGQQVRFKSTRNGTACKIDMGHFGHTPSQDFELLLRALFEEGFQGTQKETTWMFGAPLC